ncbi:hypothetical protein HY972_01995 [Candidatus Kaiserbacteria bacterium]|nr:hypothetical protein [Candidatus Kaiserbacteria bacterium]
MNSRILPLIAFFVAIGILFGYASPTWSGSIAATKAAIAADDEALAAAREYAAKQSELAAARSAIDPQGLVRLSALLPDSVDNVGLILDLNALAARSGLSLANIDVIGSSAPSASDGASDALSAAGRNPVGSIDLALSAVGTFSALQAFLGGVEKSARLLDIREIVVKGSDTGIYTYQITTRLYWLR